MMILGIGVDVVDVARFSDSITRTPKLIERVFAKSERDHKIESLAGRFAAKEAFIKALGKSEGIALNEICVTNDSEGKPWFELTGKTKETATTRGVGSSHLSISHDGGVAIAYVVLEGQS